MGYIGIDAKKDIRLNATSDLDLTSDSTTIKFGADDDVTLTHVHNTGLLLNSTNQFQFGDSGTYIHQSADGVLDLVSDTEIEINATTIDMNGNVDISGTMNASGTIGAPKGVFTSSNAGQVTLNSTSSDYMLEFQTNGTSEWWIRSSAASWKVAENGVGDHLTILASNGNVGLGTNSPSHLLDLNASSTATLRFQTSANQRMKITNTSSASAIYSHNGNPLIFGTDSSTSDTERMRIDSSGNVMIGTTTAGLADNGDQLTVSDSGNTGITIRSTNSGQNNIYFSDGTSSSEQYIGYITYQHDVNAMRFGTNDGERMRILSGGGLTFNGDTATANALDDYEEGTWTPTSPTVTLTSPSGRYTKIGREVFFDAHFTFPSTSSSVQALIDGLPFTAAATTFGSSYLRYTTFGTYTFFSISGSGNRIYAYNLSGAGVNLATVSGHRFDITGRYFV